jgi:hypothetical protein
VLRSEQQRVAGLEPPSEQRSVEQPEYLGESLLHLHRHRAPITTATRLTGTATLPLDIPPIATLLTDIRVTGSRAMVTPDIRDTPLIPVPQAMDTQTAQDIPPTPVLRVMDTEATQGILLIPVPQATDTQATRDTPLILILQTTDTQATREIPLILLPQDMDTQATRGTPLILDPQAIDIPVIQDTLLIPATRHLGTRAVRHPPRIPVPVTDTATPAIEPRSTGHLGSTTLWSLLAEVRPKCTSGSSVSELTPAYVIFAFASSAALRTPCQSRNPVVLSSSSMYRIGPKFVKYRTVSSGKFVMSWMTPLGS